MRWGAASVSTESLRWVRPLPGIVALFGEELVECEIAGIKSRRGTRSATASTIPGPITIGSARRLCREAARLPRHRRSRRAPGASSAEGAAKAAAEAGLTLVEDEGLVIENAGLTEWPVPLLGRFDAAFLDVPPEVIQLTMRVNQKYFALPARRGELARQFRLHRQYRGGRRRRGDRRRQPQGPRRAPVRREILLGAGPEGAARGAGEEARRIIFHEKLGTVADKVERVAKLADGWSRRGSSARRFRARCGAAARLAKADLVTEMVGEFPELQGVMGGYLRPRPGPAGAVADAIRDHYKPVGQGDEVPDRAGDGGGEPGGQAGYAGAFFSIGEKPTGSQRPVRAAPRRAGLPADPDQIRPAHSAERRAHPGGGAGRRLAARRACPRSPSRICSTATITSMRSPPRSAPSPTATAIMSSSAGRPTHPEYRARHDHRGGPDLAEAILDFLADRLKVQQREAGVRHDLIDAVFALGRRGRSRPPARPGERAAELRRNDGRRQPARRLQARRQHPQEGGLDGEAAPRTGEEDRGDGRQPSWPTRAPRSRNPAAGRRARRRRAQGARGGRGARNFERRWPRSRRCARRSTRSSTR